MCIANGIPAGESRERQTLRESCQCVKQSAYCAFVSTLLKTRPERAMAAQPSLGKLALCETVVRLVSFMSCIITNRC